MIQSSPQPIHMHLQLQATVDGGCAGITPAHRVTHHQQEHALSQSPICPAPNTLLTHVTISSDKLLNKQTLARNPLTWQCLLLPHQPYAAAV